MPIKVDTCPRCHTRKYIMTNEKNPLAQPICFSCIAHYINILDMHDAERFCRTYNIPLVPELWIKLTKNVTESPAAMIKAYVDSFQAALSEPGSAYADLTDATFEKLNSIWSDEIRQRDIISRIPEFKVAFIERASINWGNTYSFEELMKLEDLYYQSLKANSITNPIQRESLRTLLKVLIDINKAIAANDSQELKNLTGAFGQLAKTAQLDNMIDQTRTDDLTTLAEIVQIVEDSGFEMPYYDGTDRDGIDVAIKNIQESNARLIKGATGLGPQIEQMIAKYQQEREEALADDAAAETPLSSLIAEYGEPDEIADEDDSEITGFDFSEDDE